MRLFRRQPVRYVTLYGKPGCHLCEDARALLQRLGRRYPLHITEVDITTDPALFRKYDIVIPVLTIGAVTLEAPIRDEDVRRALRTYDAARW